MPNKKKEYNHFFVISNAESLQCLANELKETTKIDEENLDSYSGKVLVTPVLFALATELALKALYYQETKKVPPYTHDLLKLFERLGEDTQAELEVTFEELGKNTRGRLEAEWPKPLSKIRHVLQENKDTFRDWRYSFEHTGLRCFTGELDEVISTTIKTYYKRLEKERDL